MEHLTLVRAAQVRIVAPWWAGRLSMITQFDSFVRRTERIGVSAPACSPLPAPPNNSLKRVVAVPVHDLPPPRPGGHFADPPTGRTPNLVERAGRTGGGPVRAGVEPVW
ncbi:hypothetical protein AB0B10_26380 [Micromonospora arborensis]|uniref:hypothetical protein n=1 Tax=Micromonospora arborensis TaxID=2116518 RepID=UPI0033E7BFE3